MSLSAKEAAEAVGLSKPGLLKAIKQGKVSATKDHNGEWQIDPSELFRVYEPVSSSTHQPEAQSFRQDTLGNTENTESLRREVELLRERLADKDDVIKDLRQRLDAEAEERRKLTLMLTHQQQPATLTTLPPEPRREEMQPEKPKGFWSRLFR